MDSMNFEAVGASDSGLSLLAFPPRGKYLVVRRDPEDSLGSFLAMEPYPMVGRLDPDLARQTVYGIDRRLDEIAQEMPSLEIEYGALDDPKRIREAWDFLVGDVQPFSEQHYEEMRHQRVTVIPQSYGEGQ